MSGEPSVARQKEIDFHMEFVKIWAILRLYTERNLLCITVFKRIFMLKNSGTQFLNFFKLKYVARLSGVARRKKIDFYREFVQIWGTLILYAERYLLFCVYKRISMLKKWNYTF